MSGKGLIGRLKAWRNNQFVMSKVGVFGHHVAWYTHAQQSRMPCENHIPIMEILIVGLEFGRPQVLVRNQ